MLWQPPEGEDGPIVDVDPMLTRWLRPHQREGVQFMFDCVCGLRSKAGQGIYWCMHLDCFQHRIVSELQKRSADLLLPSIVFATRYG